MDKVKDIKEDESLATLLRANLSGLIGQQMTVDTLDKVTTQIVESIRYWFDKPEKDVEHE
ncbi:MAG TPA: hypothetical protein VGJ00_10410 [Rhabdochlamydiaceae bacterium]|jgi:hypothetical protein